MKEYIFLCFNCLAKKIQSTSIQMKEIYNSFHPKTRVTIPTVPPSVILGITLSIRPLNKQLFFLYLTNGPYWGVMFCKLTKIGNVFLKIWNVPLSFIKRKPKSILSPFLLPLLLLSPWMCLSWAVPHSHKKLSTVWAWEYIFYSLHKWMIWELLRKKNVIPV